jgi:hypothetical protein
MTAAPLALSSRPLARARISPLDVIAFAAPCLMFAEVVVVGRLFLSELVVLALLPFLLAGGDPQIRGRIPRAFLLLAGIWLWAQVFTDVYRSTAWVDASRGWTKVIVTAACFIALYLLLAERPRRMVLFAAGIATGQLLDFIISPNAYAVTHPWKFGIGTPITIAAFVLATTRPVQRIPLAPSAIVGAMGVANLLEGFRSLGGICILAAAYLAFATTHGHTRRRGVSPLHFGAVLCAVTAGGFLVVEGYRASAESGFLGATAQTTASSHADDGALEFISNGRPELSIALIAIEDSPLIGHGSWAKSDRYYQEYLQQAARMGTAPSESSRRERLIPSHSHLLGSWVESGVFGIGVWVWALLLAAVVLTTAFRAAVPVLPLVVLAALTVGWDVLFSPFGAERRLYMPFYLVVLVVGLREARAGRGQVAA